jgi:Flp pilus assembly pilin Flp
VKISNSRKINMKKSLGQGMTEYIIIVGVIAVAAIGAFGFFGDTIEHQIAGMSAELSGGNGAAERALSVTSAGLGSDAAANHNDLSNYSDNGQ